MNNLQILNQSILRKYRTPQKPRPLLAVIGNSGVSEEDEEAIAKADCVVRFNNYATRAHIEHTKDRTRCDILFSTFDLHSMGSAPRDVVIGIPFPFKADQIALKPRKWYPKSATWMVDPYRNMQMCKEMGLDSMGYTHPIPSIGFTALWHMKDWPVDFHIAGFAWYYNEETNQFQGWDLKNRNYPKTWNHNYPKEVEWMIKHLLPKNNIIFSNSCMRILNIAKGLL